MGRAVRVLKSGAAFTYVNIYVTSLYIDYTMAQMSPSMEAEIQPSTSGKKSSLDTYSNVTSEKEPDFSRNLFEIKSSDEGSFLVESQDQNTSLYVRRMPFKLNHEFSVHDFQFKINLQTNTTGPRIHIFENTQLIVSGLAKLLEYLKEQPEFKPEYRNMVYLFFGHPDLEQKGFNMRPFELHSSEDKIAREILSGLEATLQSYKTIDITKTMDIRIKILSMEHMQSGRVRKRRHSRQLENAQGKNQTFSRLFTLTL
jgi:hypothetical protein